MVNEERLTAAIESLMNYKAELQTAQRLQGAGLSVPNTRMNEFITRVNQGSRMVMSALDITDPDRLESLGELCLNASRALKAGQPL